MRSLSFAFLVLAVTLPAENPKVKDLEWMAGAWQGKLGNFTIDEVWMPGDGGPLAGMFRMMRDGRVTLLEFMTLEDSPEGPVLRLRHFNSALVAREEKDRPLRFALVESGAKRAKFQVKEPEGAVVILVYRATEKGLAVDFAKTGGAQPEQVTFSFQPRSR